MQTFKGGNILVNQIEEPHLEYVFHPYLITEGRLTYNALTNETVIDLDSDRDRNELIKRWFMVPKNMNLDSLLYYLRQVRTRNRLTSSINEYTIFTTVKCNASCPYCFQHGGVDSSMTIETANDVANYIINHANKQGQIRLRWFGGEPLVNKEVITAICKKLRDNNFTYISHMSSNGDLFSDVSDAELYLWNLKVVQFTLDNYGSNYDEIKVLPSGAYERLIDTCRRFESLGIGINMRVHYHSDLGKEPVLRIIDDFKEFSNIRMYAAVLYDVEHTKEDYDALLSLEDSMFNAGLIRYAIMTSPRTHYCMADSGSSRCIRVDGSFTPCEHFFDGETIGDIYSEIIDEDISYKWRSKRKYERNCIDCPLYPTCNLLSNCPSIGSCDDGYKEYLIERIKQTLRNIGGSNEQREVD